MADFAPDLPIGNIPDFTRGFHTAQEPRAPEADKSKGMLLSTLGEGIQGAANVAENTFEDFMKEKIRSGVEAWRDSTTAAYESVRRSQNTGAAVDPDAARLVGFQGTLAGGDTPLPPGLETGLDKATQLGLAKSQGKANDTLYWGALNSMAKQLRAQYPGHVDFIDEQFRKITGQDPANAYMQNLLIDINRAGGKEDDLQKQVLHQAETTYYGDKDVHMNLLAFKQGHVPFEKLEAAVNRAAARDYDRLQRNNLRDDRNNANQDSSKLAERDFTDYVHESVQSHIDPVVNLTGLTSPGTLMQIMNESRAGVFPSAHLKGPLTGPQWEQLTQSLITSKQQWLDQVRDEERKFHYARDINNHATYAGILKQGEEQWDRYIEAAGGKDLAGMLTTKRQNDLAINESRSQIYASPIGQWTKDHKVLSEDLGPAVTSMLDQRVLGLGDKLGAAEQFFNRSASSVLSSPDLRTDSNVKSLSSEIDAVRRAEASGYKVPNRVYKDLVDNINFINQAKNLPNKDRVIGNIVDHMFGPDNYKLMDQWAADFTDEKGYHLGKYGVYQILTRPEFSDAIRDSGNREAWNKYKNWAGESFKVIVGQEAKNLDSIVNSPSTNLKLTWDSTNHRFDVTGPAIDKLNQMNPLAAQAQARTGSLPLDVSDAFKAKQTIQALNGPIGSLSYIHSKDGTDVNETIWDILQQSGATPSGKIEGLPDKMLKAVQASTPSNRDRLEEALKKLGEKRKKE